MILSTLLEVGWAFSELRTEISNCSKNCSREQLYIQPEPFTLFKV